MKTSFAILLDKILQFLQSSGPAISQIIALITKLLQFVGLKKKSPRTIAKLGKIKILLTRLLKTNLARQESITAILTAHDGSIASPDIITLFQTMKVEETALSGQLAAIDKLLKFVTDSTIETIKSNPTTE